MDRKYRGGQRLAVLRREWEAICAERATEDLLYDQEVGAPPEWGTPKRESWDAAYEAWDARDTALSQRMTVLRTQAQAFPKFLEEIAPKEKESPGPNRRGDYLRFLCLDFWGDWRHPKTSPGSRTRKKKKDPFSESKTHH